MRRLASKRSSVKLVLRSLGVAHPKILRRYPVRSARRAPKRRRSKAFRPTIIAILSCQPMRRFFASRRAARSSVRCFFNCLNIPPTATRLGRSRRRRRAHLEANSFVYTLTEKDSAKVRFGITLNFFIGYESEPTAVGETTTAAADEAHRSRLVCTRLRPPKTTTAAATCRQPATSSLTSLCIISHHAFLSTYRTLLVLLAQLIDSCNLRCNARGDCAKLAFFFLACCGLSERGGRLQRRGVARAHRPLVECNSERRNGGNSTDRNLDFDDS